LAAAGERPIVVVAFANGIERLKKEHAPIDWVAADPIVGLTFGVGLAKDAPHPNAGKLFIDYLLSKAGQEITAESGYFVPRRDVAVPIMKQVPPNMKVIPLPMSLASKYNEHFQTYRKLMGLK
jgi:iron(III) transport system substrate-binding protein